MTERASRTARARSSSRGGRSGDSCVPARPAKSHAASWTGCRVSTDDGRPALALQNNDLDEGSTLERSYGAATVPAGGGT